MDLTPWITLGLTPVTLIGIIVFLYRLQRDLHKDIDELRKEDLDELRKTVHGIDVRLARVEGMMQGLRAKQPETDFWHLYSAQARVLSDNFKILIP